MSKYVFVFIDFNVMKGEKNRNNVLFHILYLQR